MFLFIVEAVCSFATNLQKLTNDIFMVQKLLGYADVNTTQRYVHFDY